MIRRDAPANPQSAIRNPQSGCPSAEQLERFLSSNLGDEELDAIAAHVNACETCRRHVTGEPDQAAWADDLRWAQQQRLETPPAVTMPLARLNELMPDYEIIAEIGRGGMGIVYEAQQVKLNRRVALKVLPALLSAVRPDAIGRFKREAELAARLKHTNIISVYDFGEVDGTLFYTMELIEGRSLRDILREINETGGIDVVLREAIGNRQQATDDVGDAKSELGTRLPRSAFRVSSSRKPQAASLPVTRLGSSSSTDKAYYRQVARWIADVAEALDYAHGLGVIHRDIKPSNLLLAANTGRLMISDFGLAKAANAGPPGSADTVTASRSLLGTARYMSPEQADDSLGPIDRRTDVYSLGATLYELLAFRPMFAAADDHEVLNQVLNKEPTPPRRSTKAVPRELETICLKALEKERANRYGSAKALRDDLERWLLDLPIHAKRPSLPNRAQKFVRRRKVASALVATAVVLLVATGFFSAGYRSWKQEAVTAQQVAQSRGVRLLLLEAEADHVQGAFESGLRKVDRLLAQESDLVTAQLLRARFLWNMRRGRDAIRYLEGIVEREPDCWAAHYRLAALYAEEDQERAAYHRETADRLMPETADAYYVRARVEGDPLQAIKLLDEALKFDPGHVDAMMDRASRNLDLDRYQDALIDADRAVAMRPDWSVPYGLRGLALYVLGRDELAIEAFDRACEMEPSFAVWWARRADVNCRLRRFAESISDANEAIRLDPDSVLAHRSRAQPLAEVGRIAEAHEDLDRAIELDPTFSDIYRVRSQVFQLEGRWEDAIKAASRAMALRSGTSADFNNRGVAYVRIGKIEEAIADFTSGLELDPQSASSHTNRGLAYSRIGRYAEAIADHTKAIALNPQYASAYENRAIAYTQNEQYAEAIADYTRLLELDPDEADAYQGRGATLTQIGEHLKAIADFGRAIQLAPENANNYRSRAIAYTATRQYKEAVADYTRVLLIDPDHLEAYNDRGVCLRRCGQLDRAIADFTEVIRRVPDDVIAIRNRGEACLLAGQEDQALADFSHLIDVQPELSDGYVMRSKVYLSRAEFEQAAADLTRVLEMEPGNAIARLRRGMAYELSGRSEPALADYERIARSGGPAGEYARLWHYILLRQDGQDAAADDVLASRGAVEADNVWTNELLDFFAGDLSSDELLATATTDDQRAEAYYYIGRQALLDNRPEDAEEAFARCVALNRIDVLETDFARALLRRVEQAGGTREGLP